VVSKARGARGEGLSGLEGLLAVVGLEGGVAGNFCFLTNNNNDEYSTQHTVV